MTIINRALLCDTIQPGQFGKINLIGVISSNAITVNSVPYTLISHLVIWGNTDTPSPELSLRIHLADGTGTPIAELRHGPSSVVSTRVTGTSPFSLFLVLPFILQIQQYGTMVISVSHEGSELYRETYGIVQGDSPNINAKAHLPQSSILTGDDKADLDHVVELLATSSRSLKILDAYFEPQSLRKLLSKTDPSIIIQAVSRPQNKTAFAADQSLSTAFPNLEVRFSAKMHDRFIIVNDSEHYHFGHSLKDVARGKLSRYSKIVSQAEVDQLNGKFQSIWGQATS